MAVELFDNLASILTFGKRYSSVVLSALYGMSCLLSSHTLIVMAQLWHRVLESCRRLERLCC